MSTGPRSLHGNNRSSQNRLTHGCCSEALILPNEKEEDWLQLRQAWIDDYQPDNPTFLSLLVETARAEWFLRRKTRQYQKFEQSLFEEYGDSIHWSEEDHRATERFTRYLTTAERRFHRHRNAVEQTRKNRELATYRQQSLELQRAKEAPEAVKSGRKSSPPHASKAEPEPELENKIERRPAQPLPPHLIQWVDISMKNGITSTTVHPSNEILLEQSRKMEPPPEVVYRSMSFHGSFPPEYHWVRNEIPGISTAREQVLTFDEWLSAIAREELAGTGHIGPKNPE